MSGFRFLAANLRARIPSEGRCLRCVYASRSFTTTTSSESLGSSSEPPMLLELRSDLKSAMRSKDTVRLDVLRGVFATASNASKTPAPIDTDTQVQILLKKQAKAARAAIAQFDTAKRADLKAKEEAQLVVLEAYINSIPTLSDAEVEEAVTKILHNLNANGNHLNYGNVMRDLIGRNGVHRNTPLKMDRVHTIVQDKIAAYKKKWF